MAAFLANNFCSACTFFTASIWAMHSRMSSISCLMATNWATCSASISEADNLKNLPCSD